MVTISVIQRIAKPQPDGLGFRMHFVFAGDWGGASTSRKITRSAKAVSGAFLCLWPHMHCLLEGICYVEKHIILRIDTAEFSQDVH